MNINTKRHTGLTLVELLVAMVIGLFLVSGVVTVMSQGKDKFLLEQEFSMIQENARFAMDEFAFEIRMAGFSSCSAATPVTNVLNVNGTDANNWMYVASAVRGYTAEDANAALAAFSGANQQAKAGTDVIIVNRGLPNDNVRVKDHNRNAPARFELTGNASYRQGDILMMVSPTCDQAAIFQLTGPATAGGSAYTHSASSSSAPGNCSVNLSFGGDCSSAPASNTLGNAFPDGSMILEFSSAAYFIRDSQITGQPTLYRQVRQRGSAALQSQELLTGVENMQILYGYNARGRGSPERYYRADSVPDWSGVLSVRIELTLVSQRAVSAPNLAANPPDDGKLRKSVLISGSIRNRG